MCDFLSHKTVLQLKTSCSYDTRFPELRPLVAWLALLANQLPARMLPPAQSFAGLAQESSLLVIVTSF